MVTSTFEAGFALRVVFVALMVFRLAQLISLDDFPFKWLRSALGRRAAKGGGVWRWLADLIHCPYCVGMWLSFTVGLYVAVYPTLLGDFVMLLFALAGLQALFQGMVDKNG